MYSTAGARPGLYLGSGSLSKRGSAELIVSVGYYIVMCGRL